MEQEPFLRLHVNGEEFHATRFNTTLFTFFGNLALNNHVFLELGEQDENVMTGAYVFCDAESYEPLTRFIVEFELPMVLNRTEVPQCDLDAWDAAHLGDIRDHDSFPEEWDAQS